MKTDDDSFVRIDAVLAAIDGRRARSKSLLLGEVEKTNGPERDINSKWYISEAVQTSPPPHNIRSHSCPV